MIRRLIDIRNSVEHADAEPPPLSECEDLLEVAWYFLRSTDMLAVRVPWHFDLEWFDDVEDGLGAALSIATGPHTSWEVQVDAVLPPDIVSRTELAGWLRVSADIMTTVADPNQPELRGWRLAVQHAREAPPDYHIIRGRIVGPNEQLLRIIQLYFEPMH